MARAWRRARSETCREPTRYAEIGAPARETVGHGQGGPLGRPGVAVGWALGSLPPAVGRGVLGIADVPSGPTDGGPMQRILPVAVAATLLAACADAPLLAPDAAAGAASRAASAASGRAASPSRPIRGTCTLLSVTTLAPAPGQPATVTRRHVEWLCQIAHLGRTRASVEETGTFTPSGPRIAAVITYAAANGDRLVTSFSGTGTFPDQSGIVTVTGSETVTGGTGRFTGATGAMTRTVSVSVIRLSGEYETRGTLSY